MDYGRRIGSLKLSTIAEVKRLPDIVSKINGDVFLIHNRSVIDATSLMGIFSLDLSEPVGLYAIAEDMEILKLLHQLEVEKYNLEFDS